MNTRGPRRTPLPELVLLALGVATGLTAGKLDWDAIGDVCAWVCIFSAVAALVTLVLSPYGTTLQVVVIGLGSVAAVLSILWYQQHRNEPYIFSPVLIGYIGGGLAVSGLITLVYRSITHPDRANSV